MEQLISFELLLGWGEAFPFSNGDVANQYGCTFRWFPMDGFVNIPNCQIYGPRLFIPTESR
jgi:hypothetical protein